MKINGFTFYLWSITSVVLYGVLYYNACKAVSVKQAISNRELICVFRTTTTTIATTTTKITATTTTTTTGTISATKITKTKQE